MVDGNLRVTLQIDYGTLHLNEFGVASANATTLTSAAINNQTISAHLQPSESSAVVQFDSPIELNLHDSLVLNFTIAANN